MERLSDNVFIHTVITHGYSVNCAVVMGSERIFVFDTLDSPEAMAPVTELLGSEADGRRIVVINSHHHWDHVYGNAAFPQCDIVAHRLCGRLIDAQVKTHSEKIPLPPQEGVLPPNVAFGDRLTFTEDTVTVHLLHAPGHSEDSIVAWIDPLSLLLAGDTVEWPFPCFAQRDASEIYPHTLRQLNQLPVNLVVPGHGPVMGKEIIDRNLDYIEGLYDVVRTAKDSRIARAELTLPVEGFAPDGIDIDEIYKQAHQDNVEWAFDEI